MSKQRFEGKVALITGAASGIGEETAKLFAEHGAHVVIVDIQDELGQQVAAFIGLDKATYIHCDIRNEKQVDEAINQTLAKYGSLDILFSNAGILGPLSSVLDMDLDSLDSVLATNVRGMAAMIKHAGRAMVGQKTCGSIICTGSISSLTGGVGPHIYTVSKHAVLGLVRAASSELGAHGIRVNCLSPSAVATPLTCNNEFNADATQVEALASAMATLKGVALKARAIAEGALFLASDESSFINGHNLLVDGGFSGGKTPIILDPSQLTDGLLSQ